MHHHCLKAGKKSVVWSGYKVKIQQEVLLRKHSLKVKTELFKKINMFFNIQRCNRADLFPLNFGGNLALKPKSLLKYPSSQAGATLTPIQKTRGRCFLTC